MIQILKKFCHREREYFEQNPVVKLGLWKIFLIIVVSLVFVITLMLLLVWLLPESYFGISNTPMMSFIGSSISGVAAFCAIIISYFQTRKIQEENRKNIRSEKIDSLKPFITLESINGSQEEKPSGDISISVNTNTDQSIESPLLFDVKGNNMLNMGR